MKKGGIGGGNTKTGINFEGKTDFINLLDNLPGYSTKKVEIGYEIFFRNELVAQSFKKYDFYKFLNSKSIEWQKIVSKRLLPDDAIYVIHNNILYILEMKYQEVGGSVDEKLQTCDFKIKQYKKIMSQLNIDIKYIYILNDWFRKDCYKDVLDYVISVDCQYYFEYLPLQKIGLPVPKTN
ncbi:MAG: hypothetical protein PHW50_03305 [Patescibacteria group bacterium]|nr:hypothetical protein [Patescibacteria group bacterium]